MDLNSLPATFFFLQNVYVARTSNVCKTSLLCVDIRTDITADVHAEYWNFCTDVRVDVCTKCVPIHQHGKLRTSAILLHGCPQYFSADVHTDKGSVRVAFLLCYHMYHDKFFS